jgi:glyoxylase-like metal-dependent hydrolase (beta-lactamase superfamily II)/rhodanese-related sulfurtransferase
MVLEQLYTKCLSEAAYFIASDGEAAVVDPLRDVDEYIRKAEEMGVKIKYIFETHFHADFVSGHLELSQRTGAPIIYGPNTETKFDVHVAADGEEFSVGKLKIKVMHTPGHTLESTSYLLYNEEGKPHCVFTGDTLFVGDVGRPDLFSGNMSKEELAGMMYESLNDKIKTLADDVIVFPAHGPGSSCGKNLGAETYSTIGQQKATNYALQDMTKEEFIKVVTDGLSTPPAYFPLNAKINKEGYESMDALMRIAMTGFTVPELKEKLKEEVVLLDTRPATVFTQAFIPGAISIGLEGRFAEWAGSLLPFDQPMVLVTEPGKEEETVVRLARVGFENVQGYLEGGISAWINAGEKVDMIIDIEPDELAMDIPHDDRLEVLDVRKESEYDAGHVKGATNAPLDSLRDIFNIALISSENNLYVHCAGGYRSVIAASLLKRQGYHNLRNVLGGFSKMKDQKGLKIVTTEKESA